MYEAAARIYRHLRVAWTGEDQQRPRPQQRAATRERVSPPPPPPIRVEPRRAIFEHTESARQFRFEIVEHADENFRLYILESPLYGLRPDDAVVTHRLVERDRLYICVDARSYPATFEDAVFIAATWAKLTVRYIDTGRKF